MGEKRVCRSGTMPAESGDRFDHFASFRAGIWSQPTAPEGLRRTLFPFRGNRVWVNTAQIGVFHIYTSKVPAEP